MYFSILLIVGLYHITLYADQGENNFNNYVKDNNRNLIIDEAIILEDILEPSKYILGPGDKLGLSITTSSDMAYFMDPYITVITPTGDLWIPDVGSIHIAGKSIQNAEQHIIQFIKKKAHTV